MSTPSDPIRFAGGILGEHRHVCAFFRTRDEEYRTLLPFVQEGLRLGERVFQVVDPAEMDEHLRRLRGAGIDVDRARRKGQLEIRVPGETYLRNGRFDQDEMLTLVQDVLRKGRSLNFPLTRLVAHAECVLDVLSAGVDWLAYESRLHRVLPRYRDPVICAYDSERLRAGMAFDILRTHPMVILGGVLHENPFFVSPDEFLPALEGHGGMRPGKPSVR